VTLALDLVPALTRPDLLAPAVFAELRAWEGERPVERVTVAEIDPGLADTAEFCATYGVAPGRSANCVVVSGRRGGETRIAACVVLATTRADVNTAVRQRLDVRKCSFLPMETAVAETGMEHGGITPIGLPVDWPVLVDRAVVAAGAVIVGSGVRRSKLEIPGDVLAGLPRVEVVDGLGKPVAA
jgi:prolyl-tRNA editing enzyme YbaK/EbsC (Cys-tRNA(Pro) deacylase)